MGNLGVTAAERTWLRELARRQADYAALPVMGRRRKMWFDVNTSVDGARPPVVIETWTFDRDFMPEGVITCRSDTARYIEGQLIRNIRNHELINDDKVIPDTFDIRWLVTVEEFGLAIPTDRIEDGEGVKTGYRFHHPLKDLTRDLDLLKPARCSVDREGTLELRDTVEEILGDILPVRIRSHEGPWTFLTHRVIPLLGMEAFFLAMYDTPRELHRLMAYLRDNALSILRWYESEGLLVVNNGNQDSFGTSYNFTDQLPAPDYDGSHARLKDMFLSSNSQETVGVSPELFEEFCFPYYRDVCEPMGLLYWGCCEPAHPFWSSLSRLPHLKKVSISKWCDERFMGDALRGTPIVYSRKPDPNFLSVDKTLDEEAWGRHITATLDATRGVSKEFIIRDVYTLHGNIGNAREAIRVARRRVDAYYGQEP